MKITRVSGNSGCGKTQAIYAMIESFERQGKAVLQVGPDSTSAGIIAMCTKPVHHAIVICEFDPAGSIDLDKLNATPALDKVFCILHVTE